MRFNFKPIDVEIKKFIDISEWYNKYLTISIRICFSGTIYFPLHSLRENTYPVILFMFSKSFDDRKRELYVT